jgi:hypothetical protein
LRFAFSKASNRSHRSNLRQVSLRAIPASLADAAENAKTRLATDARWNPSPIALALQMDWEYHAKAGIFPDDPVGGH